MKLLLVESEGWLGELLAGWLREEGFEVVVCPGPQGPDFSCRGMAREGCPLAHDADVVVLDLELDSDLLLCGVPAWELLHLYRRLGKRVIVLAGSEDVMRPLPGDRLAVLRRPPERETLSEAVGILVAEEPGPEAEEPYIVDVEVPGTRRRSRRRLDPGPTSGQLGSTGRPPGRRRRPRGDRP